MYSRQSFGHDGFVGVGVIVAVGVFVGVIVGVVVGAKQGPTSKIKICSSAYIES
jgi:hypothetical protein